MTQPYPTPYPPPGWGPPPPQQQNNGLATGGFVTALVGAILALIPLLGVVAWIISPVGLVLSIVGLTAASKRGGTGRGLAIAGIVLGVVGLLICVLYVAAFSAAVRQGAGTTTPAYRAPSYTTPTTQAAREPVPTAASGTATAPSVTGPFSQGTYLVGEDIQPGRYRTDGAPQGSIFPFCAASRQRADGTPVGIPEATNNGPAFITVQASDGQVEFSGECTWSRR